MRERGRKFAVPLEGRSRVKDECFLWRRKTLRTGPIQHGVLGMQNHWAEEIHSIYEWRKKC